MCGICGYISRKKVEDRELIRMRDTMIHRGPDDSGIWNEKISGYYVGFAHRRLSIFDLSELGHQPMISEDGSLIMVYNGEIYNFKEIRIELQEEGFHFKSECDSEVLLYAYDRWREECFSKFNGMFSVAIWDIVEEKLVIARDRMGVKPFYYYWDKYSGDFVFGSELKPIMNFPWFVKDIDKDCLYNYLCNKYIAAPKTIFKNTYKLEPGTYGVFQKNKIVIRKFWDILEQKSKANKKEIRDFDSARDHLRSVITDAVTKRMIADVPVGIFLSSGIDSALVASIAQDCSSLPVKTFTIGFNEAERNEAGKASEIAKYLGTIHKELYIEDKELFDMIEDLPLFYDEPFSDASQLPTMLVSKLAAEDVTVALSGDGGDELFCGYKIYDLVYIAQKADFIGSVIYQLPGMNMIKGILSPEVRAFINNRGDFRTQLFTDVISECADSIIKNVHGSPKFELERRIKYQNWQERRMMLDMSTYLPDEIMAKTDRASMKYSLEVRSPLLDYRVVEKSFEIPHRYKYSRFDKKHILKSLVYDYIPEKLLSGPKRGFGVPLAKWLRGPLKKEIMNYSNENLLIKQGLFDVRGIKDLIRKQEECNKIIYSSVLWSFYVFQRWWRQYVY